MRASRLSSDVGCWPGRPPAVASQRLRPAAWLPSAVAARRRSGIAEAGRSDRYDLRASAAREHGQKETSIRILKSGK
jgi:hypothetical protein